MEVPPVLDSAESAATSALAAQPPTTVPTPAALIQKAVSDAKPLEEVVPTSTPTEVPLPSPTAFPTVTATPEPRQYTVVEGDTLSYIAKKHEVSVESLMAINGIGDADELKVGTALIIPSAEDIIAAVAEQGTPIPTPQTDDGDWVHYVQAGQTLSEIAAQYDIDRLDLLHANGLRPDSQLIAGQTLIIPTGSYVAVPTATPAAATPVPTIVVALGASATPTLGPPATATPQPTPISYVVAAGDVAGLIAKEHEITLDELAAANPSVALDQLSIGQTLNIPVAAASAGRGPAAVVPTATPTPANLVFATHVVGEGESLEEIAGAYRLPPSEIALFNFTQDGEVEPGQRLRIPLGTPTPTPLPTLAPTATATPAPAYLAPRPLLPANGSRYTLWASTTRPLLLLWTSSGILADDEYYVVRLRAVDDQGRLLWSTSQWSETPSWRVTPETLAQIRGEATLRWDVMVMQEREVDEQGRRIGIALSGRSQTFEVSFVNRIP